MVQKIVNLIFILSRPRQKLSNEYLVAKFGFDTDENESSKVFQKVVETFS